MGAEIEAVDEGANEAADEGEDEAADETADETTDEPKNKLNVFSVWQNPSLTLSTGSPSARGFPAPIKVTSSLRYQKRVWVVSGSKIQNLENIGVPHT